LQRNHSFAQQLDTYANIMVALSSAIFIFSFSQMDAGRSLFWVVLGLATGLATIFSLLMIRPPKQLRKRGQKESLMFKSEIISQKSAEEYGDRLEKMLGNKTEVIDQFGREIYNVAKYYYRPKKIMFFWARGVLLVGMSASLILFLLGI